MIEIIICFIGQPPLELLLFKPPPLFGEKYDKFFELFLVLDLHKDVSVGIIEAEFFFIH